MKKICSLILFLIILVSAKSQTTISGTVQDDSGEPLIGVNIVLQSNNAIGTISDFNGGYSLDVTDMTDSLVFSYIGYQSQTVAIAGRTQINITMSLQANVLDDIVVVGYGVQRKSDLTGSIFQCRSRRPETSHLRKCRTTASRQGCGRSGNPLFWRARHRGYYPDPGYRYAE